MWMVNSNEILIGKLHILLGSPFSFCEFLMIPSGKLKACYGKSPSLMGKPNYKCAIFNSYIKLAEGTLYISYLHVCWGFNPILYPCVFQWFSQHLCWSPPDFWRMPRGFGAEGCAGAKAGRRISSALRETVISAWRNWEPWWVCG